MGIEPTLTESQSVLLPLQHSHTKENFGRCTENRTLVYWLKASYFTTKLYTQILAGDTRIELVLLESKSSVLPLHQSPSESRIVKEHFSTMAIKQKTLWIFISEGLVSIQLYLSIYLPNPQNPQSHYIQMMCVSMSSHLIAGDVSARIYFLSS